ncbi:MAG: antibiotic biosynthesis monooxygenase [Microbacteriaceae bacterium]|nr:antibiotic biosynthesis monooxygenase [Microbacteriaceae bacterium]
MSQPDVTVVRIVPQPGRTAAILEVMQDLVPVVHEEDGCILYTLNVEGNGDIWFVEKWASRAAADFHGQHSSILPELMERTSPLMQGPPEIHSLVPFPIGGPKGAL